MTGVQTCALPIYSLACRCKTSISACVMTWYSPLKCLWLCIFFSSPLLQGIDAINQSKVVELLKDGGAGGAERRQSREGMNGPGGPRGDCEGEEGAEWNGVRGI